MKSLDAVGVTFVNTVLARGVLNGVVNLQLGTYLLTPNQEGTAIEEDLVVSCRLRMDQVCARQLHDALGSLLAAIDAYGAHTAVPDAAGTRAN